MSKRVNYWQFKVLALLLFTVASLTNTVLAVPSNVGPSPSDVDPASSIASYSVARANYINIPQTSILIYSQQQNLSLVIQSADLCENDTEVAGVRDTRNTGAADMNTGTQVSRFNLNGGAPEFGVKRNNCTFDTARRTLTGTSNNTVTTANGQFYVHRLVATWMGSACGDNHCGVNGFVVRVANDGNAVVTQEAAAENGIGNSLSDAANYGIRAGSNANEFIDYTSYFGAPCTLTSPTQVNIRMYDDDNTANTPAQPAGTGSGARPFLIKLEEAPKDNSTPWQRVNITASVPNNTFTMTRNNLGVQYKGETWRYVAAKRNNNPASVDENSGGRINIGFTVRPGFKYRFVIGQMFRNNNLQFQLPYSGFWTQQCPGWNINGRSFIDGQEAGRITRPAGSTVSFAHLVNNGGTSATNPTQISMRPRWSFPTAGTTGSPPTLICNTNNPALGGTYQQQIPAGGNVRYPTTGGYVCTIPPSAPPGTQYCQDVRFEPRSFNDTNASASTAACVTVGSPSTTASCTLNLSALKLEIHSNPTINRFNANYNVQVRQIPPNENSPPTVPAPPSPAPGTSQTQTWTEVRYSVVNARLNSVYDGSRRNTPTPQSLPDGPGPTYNASTTFSYGSELNPREYTVDGVFTYEVRRTEIRYSRTTSTNSEGVRSVGGISQSQTNSTISSGTVDCNEESMVYIKKPYVQFFGGDVNAATTFGGAGGLGQIHAFNQGSSGSYAGSGVQVAAFAGGTVNEFVSGALNSSLRPKGLTFANSSGTYGGNFGASGYSVPDSYWDMPPGAPSSRTISSFDNARNRYTEYVNGDVYITGNVQYPSSFSLANVPKIQVVASGNIYISAGVTRLDGIYAARGTIYTCATSSAANQGYVVNSCNNQLRINGSLLSGGIKLHRVQNSLYQATTTQNYTNSAAAEVFFFSPESWLQALMPDPTNRSTNDKSFDAITSLPPVL